MATCPHCGTENKDKAKFCINCRKPLPMKVKRLGGTKPLAEKVPAWLTQLLDNHKEKPGPLIGLAPADPQPMPRKPKTMEEDDTDLSVVLDQLARQGPQPPSGDRLASSVEWGAYAEITGQEPPAHSIDDMLAGIEYSPEDAYASGTVQAEQPATMDQEAPGWGVPDWLTDDLTAPTGRDIESGMEPLPYPEPGAPPADAPDWLTEVIPPDEGSIDTPDPLEPHQTGQLPDWLTDTSMDFAPAIPSEETELLLPPITGHDVPNWLADATESPAAQELEQPSDLLPPLTPEESGVTDWLRDSLEPPPEAGEEPVRPTEPEPSIPAETAPWLEPDLLEVDETEPEAEVPDWITEIVPPAAAALQVEPLDEPLAADTDAEIADWAVPDWIAAAQMTEDEEAELKATLPPDSQDIPDWMVEEQAPTRHEIEPPGEATEPAVDDTGPPDPEDWLAALDTPASIETVEPTKAPLPPGTDWLSEVDLPPVGESKEAAPEASGVADTDWLFEADQSAFEDSQEALADAMDIPGPDWLAGTAHIDTTAPPETVETGAVPGSIPGDDVLFPSPDEADVEEEPKPKPVRKLKRLKPLKRLSPKPEDPSQPDWVAGLVPPGATDQRAEESAAPPDWAADLVPPSADLAMELTAPAPDWARELVPPDADKTPETSAEAEELIDQRLDWLTGPDEPETPAKSADVEPTTIEADGDMPDRLAESTEEIVMDESPAPPTDEELDAPDWLGEISGMVEETEEEIPDWLAESSEMPDVGETAEEEQGGSAWVAASLAAGGILAATAPEDQAQAEDEQAEFSPVLPAEEIIAEPPAAAEEEATDWLSELRLGAPDVDELEAPEWLPEAPVEETPGPLAEEEVEIPEWLGKDSETPFAEETMAPPVTVEETEETDWLPAPSELETETPDWLLESAETPDHEEPPAPSDADAGEEMLETPSWLSELAAVPVEAEESETPNWLAEIPAAPATGPLTTPAVSEEESEVPEWLAEIPAAPATGPLTAPPVSEEETEVPEWLAEIPAAPATGPLTAPPVSEEETDLPPWLMPPAPAAETEAIEPVAHEAEEADLPDWLADLQAAPETHEETETPEWMAEISEVPPTEEMAPQSETLEEPPDGETEVSITEEVEAAPLAETAADAELPDWLLEEEELDTPDWLVEATGLPPIDTDDEIPEWLAEEEISKVEEEDGTGLAAAAGLAATAVVGGAFIESIGEEEPAIEKQVELSEPEGETSEPPTSSKEEAEIPPWLSDLPEEPAGEEVPDGLAETPHAPVVEETAPTPETDEASEMPEWLAGLRAIPADEDEAETPVWPEESADAPTDRATAPQPDITEEETPAWFSPTQATPIAAKEDAADIELPPWLAELPSEPMEAESPETAEWLTEIVDTPTAEAAEAPETPIEDEEGDGHEGGVGLAAAGGLAASAAIGGTLIKSAVEEKPEKPDWLARLSEPLDAEEAPDLTEEQAESPDSAAEKRPVPPVDEVIETTEAETETPDWLAELGADSTSEEDLVIPDWLSGSIAAATATVAADDTIVSPLQQDTAAIEKTVEEVQSTEEAEPEIPNWLSDSSASPAAPADTSTTSVVDSRDIGLAEAEPEPDTPVEKETDQPPASPDSEVQTEIGQKDVPDQAKTDAPTGKPAEKKSPVGGVESSVHEADDEDLKVAEATGVLVGLSSLLPAQEVIAGTSVAALGPAAVEGHKDAVLKAAGEFQAVATYTPQPATLPLPLTRRDHLVRGGARAALYLLFIILIAIPLIPGFQKITSSGQTLAWTEPTGSLGEVLDKQRRELISTELGVVDFQQPGAVALVSFDYTPATQGEMQPLAEAVIGRLKGQGMRLIFLSLEPEGATLAQQTMHKILEERGEEYGVNMLNLGYMPGQVAAIRTIASGQPFSNLTDYNSGVPFGAGDQPNWSDVENIGQVEMVVTLADNATTGRWWVEQMSTAIEPDNGERALLAVTSAVAGPYLQPYRASEQLNGLISGINGAAAIEASRKNFGPARQMLDSQSIAHLLIIILIAVGTMVGWMPSSESSST